MAEDDTPAPSTPGADLPTPGSGLSLAAQWALQLVAENKAVTIVGYTGFVFLKVLAATKWTLTTALAVMSLSSLPGIVAGATLSAVPMIVLLVLAVIVYLWTSGYWSRYWLPPRSRTQLEHSRRWGWLPGRIRRNYQLLATLVALCWLAVLLPPAFLSVLAVALALVVGLVVRGWRAAVHHRLPPVTADPEATVRVRFGRRISALAADRPAASGLAVVLLTLALAGYPQFFSSVWLPHETLRTPNGQVLDVGYVINDGGGSLTVLRSQVRTLHTYPAAAVGERFVCNVGYSLPVPLGRYSVQTLLQRVSGTPQLPVCGTVPR